MENEPNNKLDSDMLEEYDFTQGVRGKYAKRYIAGSKAVVLDPDVAEVSLTRPRLTALCVPWLKLYASMQTNPPLFNEPIYFRHSSPSVALRKRSISRGLETMMLGV
jgi:hypothetical protein